MIKGLPQNETEIQIKKFTNLCQKIEQLSFFSSNFYFNL